MFETWLITFVVITFVITIFLDLCLPTHLAQLSARIPGPRKIPLIGYYGLPSNGKEQLKFLKDMLDTYGHIFKVWKGNKLHIILSDPYDVEAVIGSTVALDKGNTYNFLHPWLGFGLLTSSGVKWQMRRKAITPTFHFKILEQFIDVFNKKGSLLIDVIEERIDGDFFDVAPYISNYTLDVICETAMGVEVNAQGSEVSPYVATVKKMLEFVQSLRNKCWILNNFLLFFKLKKERDQMLKVLHGFTNSIIKSKRRQKINSSESSQEADIDTKKKIAFLELLINLSEKPESSIKCDEDIREEVDTFMFEGHDTTSSALCSILMFLGKYPAVQAKVREEIEELIPSSEYDLTYKDIQGLKYTEMVIKEALRHYPPVPSISRTLTNDIKLPSGYTLPAESVVTIDIYHLHRNLSQFPNPEEFNPDNFLLQNSVGRHSFSFIPFSAGPRNCIGQKFAMTEMKATVAKFVYNYKVFFGKNGTNIDPSLGLIFKSANGYHVKLSRHQKNNDS